MSELKWVSPMIGGASLFTTGLPNGDSKEPELPQPPAPVSQPRPSDELLLDL